MRCRRATQTRMPREPQKSAVSDHAGAPLIAAYTACQRGGCGQQWLKGVAHGDSQKSRQMGSQSVGVL